MYYHDNHHHRYYHHVYYHSDHWSNRHLHIPYPGQTFLPFKHFPNHLHLNHSQPQQHPTYPFSAHPSFFVPSTTSFHHLVPHISSKVLPATPGSSWYDAQHITEEIQTSPPVVPHVACGLIPKEILFLTLQLTLSNSNLYYSNLPIIRTNSKPPSILLKKLL